MLLEAERPLLLGNQVPTHLLVPEYDWSHGNDAIELAKLAGYELDPWQQQLLRDGLGVKDGRWAASEVATVVSRQNGKSVDLEVVALAALLLLDVETVLYTAHKTSAAQKIFERLIAAFQTEELRPYLATNGIRYTNGEQGITLRTGQNIQFRTRTGQQGRSFTVDVLFLDEAQHLTDEALAALMPMLSARPDPQVWYAGSAGTQISTVLGRVVRAAEAKQPRLVYYGWHADETDDPADPATWAKVNPGFNVRVTQEWVATEHRRMLPGTFAIERLGIGDYPRLPGEDWVIPEKLWDAHADPDSMIPPTSPLVWCVEVKPDLSWGAISVAGRRADRDIHLEVVAHARGVQWLPTRFLELVGKWGGRLVLDPKSQASFMLGPLKDAGLTIGKADDAAATVVLLTALDLVDAFSWLYAAATGPVVSTRPQSQPSVRHRGAKPLTAALAAASVRKLLDRQAWRRQGSADASPLVSANLAGYGVQLLERAKKKPAPPPVLVSAAGGRAGGDNDVERIGF